MTKEEYKEQSERLKQYKSAMDKISVIERKKSQISVGICFIQTPHENIDFDYLGDDFGNRLMDHITSFLDTEIQKAQKEMEAI